MTTALSADTGSAAGAACSCPFMQSRIPSAALNLRSLSMLCAYSGYVQPHDKLVDGVDASLFGRTLIGAFS